ncbi:1,2-phenylacetyl-CoA epoxidase subunit PaaD [Longispora albida]|uniref:1,2-phenylacetyl-CoA epoxidase subunit PaaD n=1 Tax=Longispora albida TaxID=203523 RepID=UPI000371ABD2|nr:1,2-phenylacetyl-CoA epoxidase subunit PaaD [Longispora albida]
MTRGEYEAVAAVPDPEIPTVTIEDLGILRDVEVEGSRVVVTITPTYSGCPAMDTIRTDIRRALPGRDVEVRTVLSPAWTTDWITDAGREKLAKARIAPPWRSDQRLSAPPGTLMLSISVRCPNCGSPDTTELSRFGSTACKSLWRCRACGDPFDHFKAI